MPPLKEGQNKMKVNKLNLKDNEIGAKRDRVSNNFYKEITKAFNLNYRQSVLSMITGIIYFSIKSSWFDHA